MKSLLLALTAVTTLAAGELDPADRKILLDHLDQSSSEFVDAIKGLTAAQWSYKPAADRWSIAECAEHVVLTEDLLRGMVETKIMTTPASPERVAERTVLDRKVLPMITDRSFKAKAPEALKPTGQFPTPEATIEKFRESRAKTIAFVKSRSDFREHAAPHPAFKELDGYQWLLYLSGHSARHTAQIREVKDSAGFPKGN